MRSISYSAIKWPPPKHNVTLPSSNTCTHIPRHLPRGATTTRHVSRAPVTKISKIQPRVPLNLNCYKISPSFLIGFPNSLKSQSYRNYQNTLSLSLNRELTNFLRLIALRHHESINKLFKHINNHTRPDLKRINILT